MQKHFKLLSAAGLLASAMQVAQAQTPVPLSNLYAWMPGNNVDGVGVSTTFANAPSGHVGLLTVELNDDYDAVQIGVSNQNASWGVDQIAVAPSASYGGAAVTGSAAYDLDDHPLDEMLPVQWFHAGANSTLNRRQELSLPLQDAAPAGQTTLSFASLAAAPAYGGLQPLPGWHVKDGLGCIAAGTTIVSTTGSQLVLSAPTAAAGCQPGQAIYFSDLEFGPFKQTFPAAPGTSLATLSFSDWVPITSLPRIDGGYTLGAGVTGTGVAPNTSLAAIGFDSLTLSKPLDAAVPAGTELLLAWSPAASAAVKAGSTTLPVTDKTGLAVGQTVKGGGVPKAAHVASLLPGGVTLDVSTTEAIPAGEALHFSSPAWTTLPANAGDTVLGVPSTSAHKLLHIRYFTTAGSTPTFRKPDCTPDAALHTVACETPLGIPPVWSSIGGQSAGNPIDGIDYVASVGAGAGAPANEGVYPTFFIRFRGRHAGATFLGCGDFQMSGATGSVSGEASFANIAAAAASAAYPATPISLVNTSTALDTSINYANCQTWMNAITPGLVLFQDYSNHNGGTVAQFQQHVKTLADQVLAYGGQPIIYLGYNEGTFQTGQMLVAGAVKNSSLVPLTTGMNGKNAGNGYLVAGPGIAAGTTADVLPGAWSLTLSKPATIPAGSVINFADQVMSNTGTSVTLAYPSFETIGKILVSGTGLPTHTKIALRQGKTAGTLSKTSTIPAGTLLTIYQPTFDTPGSYYAAAVSYRGLTNQPWAAIQVDGAHAVSTGSLYDGPMCNGCTTQGRYANDYGNSLIAAELTPVLEQLTGH